MIYFPSDCYCSVTLVLVGVVLAEVSEGKLDRGPSPTVVYLRYMGLKRVIRLRNLNLARYRDKVIRIPIVPEDGS